MNLLSTLNDDQIALLGCAGALLATGSLMSLSYFLGRWRLQVPAMAKTGAVARRSARDSDAIPASMASKKRRNAA
jgi:hypothetical protein